MQSCRDARIVARPKPLTHFTAVEPRGGEAYRTLPDTHALKWLRHQWVLVRHERPRAPVLHKQQLPNPKRTEDENGGLYNVYVRPWVLNLDDATEAIPHANWLGFVIMKRPVGMCSVPATQGPASARSADYTNATHGPASARSAGYTSGAAVARPYSCPPARRPCVLLKTPANMSAYAGSRSMVDIHARNKSMQERNALDSSAAARCKCCPSTKRLRLRGMTPANINGYADAPCTIDTCGKQHPLQQTHHGHPWREYTPYTCNM